MRIDSKAIVSSLFAATLAVSACSKTPSAAGNACQEIRKACIDAGFIKGGGKQGIGIMADCIRPIMDGTPQPKKATKPLPKVDPSVVSACKSDDPSFGQKKQKHDQSGGEGT